MHLRRCPGCKNMVAMESVCCPICGVDPRKRRVMLIVKWTLVVACAIWAAERLISKHRAQSRHADAQSRFVGSTIVAVAA